MLIQNAHQLVTYAKMNFCIASRESETCSFFSRFVLIYYIVLNILFLNQSLLQSPDACVELDREHVNTSFESDVFTYTGSKKCQN